MLNTNKKISDITNFDKSRRMLRIQKTPIACRPKVALIPLNVCPYYALADAERQF